MALLTRKEVRPMATGKTWKDWERENTTTINVRLHKTHDADILEGLERAKENGEPKISAIKRWARIGISVDNERKK